MNKKVIYTCITGDYDVLKEPVIVTEGWDYICFTDQDLTSKNWKIVKTGKTANQVKEQRRKKIFNEYILSEYDESIWVDGSIYINCDLNTFKAKHFDTDFCLMNHPTRDCIYQEAYACIALNKDKKENILEQVEGYKSEGLPANEGMVATGIMYRRHTFKVIDFCKKWWGEVFEKSHRDQLSFNYIVWRERLPYSTFPFDVLKREFVITSHKR